MLGRSWHRTRCRPAPASQPGTKDRKPRARWTRLIAATSMQHGTGHTPRSKSNRCADTAALFQAVGGDGGTARMSPRVNWRNSVSWVFPADQKLDRRRGHYELRRAAEPCAATCCAIYWRPGIVGRFWRGSSKLCQGACPRWRRPSVGLDRVCARAPLSLSGAGRGSKSRFQHRRYGLVGRLRSLKSRRGIAIVG